MDLLQHLVHVDSVALFPAPLPLLAALSGALRHRFLGALLRGGLGWFWLTVDSITLIFLFFNSRSEVDKLPKAAGGKIAGGWIGLQRDPNNKTAWKWSGGGHITYQNWKDGEPDNYWDNENNGGIIWEGKWSDTLGTKFHYFYFLLGVYKLGLCFCIN
uniref:C-type lectin domain-containing protein n=1 Tax=Amphiprion percula TaxID=161767 RepID=A0A3P8S0D0_AMPPE